MQNLKTPSRSPSFRRLPFKKIHPNVFKYPLIAISGLIFLKQVDLRLIRAVLECGAGAGEVSRERRRRGDNRAPARQGGAGLSRLPLAFSSGSVWYKAPGTGLRGASVCTGARARLPLQRPWEQGSLRASCDHRRPAQEELVRLPGGRARLGCLPALWDGGERDLPCMCFKARAHHEGPVLFFLAETPEVGAVSLRPEWDRGVLRFRRGAVVSTRVLY